MILYKITWPSCVALSILVLASPVRAFETAWHYHVTEETASAHGFSRYSADVLHIGTWGPDYLQVIQLLVGAKLAELTQSHQFALIPGIRGTIIKYSEQNPSLTRARELSELMHFDNIAGSLDSNDKFFDLFTQLHHNGIDLITEVFADAKLDDNTKQVTILLALGSMLHMVQDFYSHTNWVDIDFSQYPGWDIDLTQRLPTYFEARDLFGHDQRGKTAFPFKIASGIYDLAAYRGVIPNTAEGIPMTHSSLSHDNSQLKTNGVRAAPFHQSGMIPAGAEPLAHQQLAVVTAIAACKELLDYLHERADVAQAIDFAKTINRRSLLLKSDASIVVEGMLRSSCIVAKLDGDSPMPEQDRVCTKLRLSLQRVYTNLLRGNWELIPSPSNRFWKIYIDADILGRLAPHYPGLQR